MKILNEVFDKVLVLTTPYFEGRIENMKQRLEGCEYEFFYGTYGKEIFEDRCALLKRMCTELGLDLYVEKSTFPTFNELVSRFHTAGRKENGAMAGVMD